MNRLQPHQTFKGRLETTKLFVQRVKTKKSQNFWSTGFVHFAYIGFGCIDYLKWNSEKPDRFIPTFKRLSTLNQIRADLFLSHVPIKTTGNYNRNPAEMTPEVTYIWGLNRGTTRGTRVWSGWYFITSDEGASWFDEWLSCRASRGQSQHRPRSYQAEGEEER